MKTLFDPAAYQEITRRVESLQPGAPRQWGKMTVSQMLEHSARALEIAVGFVMAFIASALVVKPFLQYVRRSGFAPFAWYRIALGLALLAAVAAGWM